MRNSAVFLRFHSQYASSPTAQLCCVLRVSRRITERKLFHNRIYGAVILKEQGGWLFDAIDRPTGSLCYSTDCRTNCMSVKYHH